MTEIASALVDSNVIIDITGGDLNWRSWSAGALQTCKSAYANPIIFAELCYVKQSPAKVNGLLNELNIGFQELSRDALFLAAQAYKLYRKRGGSKTAPLPDFFIGAQALDLGTPIITRDVSRYQSYFPTVRLISPEPR